MPAPVADHDMDVDSEYASSDDPDFAPEAAAGAADTESEAEADDSEDELAIDHVSKKVKQATKPVRQRKDGNEAEEIDFENSGDEAVIEKGLKKQRREKKGKRSGKGEDDDDEDEGGEGGFVRTRAMKAAAGPESWRALASTETATVDVDALWKQMMAEPFKRVEAAPQPQQSQDELSMDMDLPTPQTGDGEELITIERTYNFAGKVHSESKLVPRHSAEAQLWLKTHPLPATTTTTAAPPSTTPAVPTTRPIRRPTARRSIFEPANDLLSPRTDLRFKTTTYKGPSLVELEAQRLKEKAKKLNTVEKSKMDWAGFVDKEGLKEDLEKAGKRKGAYLDNQEFLARAGERREEEGRRARGVVV